MPCPLFLPDSPLGGTALAGSASAAPLGAVFEGLCGVDPQAEIPESLLKQGCNTGYARDKCPRAAAIENDATRFRIKSHISGIIEVAWSLERDHHPVAVGTLRLAELPETSEPLELQARACAAVYLRRTGAGW